MDAVHHLEKGIIMANLVTFAKKLWKDATSGGTPITAAELNRMEGGINDCATQINKLGDSVSRVQFAQEGTVFRVSYTADDGVLQLSIVGTPLAVWFDKKRGIGIWDSNEKKNYVCTFVE